MTPLGDLDGWLDCLIDRPAARRREILDPDCDDPELRAHVERVLAAEEQGPLGEGFAAVAPGLGGLGRAHLELGEPERAKAPLREAVSILAETLEPGSTRTADLRIWLSV